MRSHDPRLSDIIKEISETITATNKQAKSAKELAQGVFGSLDPQKTEREAEVLCEIESARHYKEKILMSQKDELEHLLKGLRDSIVFSETLLSEGSEVEIVKSFKAVQTRLESLINGMATTPLLPVTDALIEFEREEDWIDSEGILINDVGCVITSENISVGRSQANKRSNENVPLDWEYSFDVILANKKGSILVIDGPLPSSFEMKVEGPSKDVKVHSFPHSQLKIEK